MPTRVSTTLLNTPSLAASRPQPVRALSIADPFVDVTAVNWVLATLFLCWAPATLLLRRMARPAETGSAA